MEASGKRSFAEETDVVKRMGIVLCVMLLAGSVYAQQNLISNGGFEQERKTDFGDKLPKDIRRMFGGALRSPFQDWGFGGGWDPGWGHDGYSTDRGGRSLGRHGG